MRTVGSAARPIHEERFVGRKGFVVLQPADGVVSEILAQVIIVMAAGGLRRMNNSCISLLTPPGAPVA